MNDLGWWKLASWMRETMVKAAAFVLVMSLAVLAGLIWSAMRIDEQLDFLEVIAGRMPEVVKTPPCVSCGQVCQCCRCSR